MAHVGRQGQHLLVDLGTVGIPAEQPPDGKGVAQVVQAGRLVSATIDPAETVAQAGKDAMRLSLAERQPQSATATADQKRHAGYRRKMPLALSSVASQRLDRAR